MPAASGETGPAVRLQPAGLSCRATWPETIFWLHWFEQTVRKTKILLQQE